MCVFFPRSLRILIACESNHLHVITTLLFQSLNRGAFDESMRLEMVYSVYNQAYSRQFIHKIDATQTSEHTANLSHFHKV